MRKHVCELRYVGHDASFYPATLSHDRGFAVPLLIITFGDINEDIDEQSSTESYFELPSYTGGR